MPAAETTTSGGRGVDLEPVDWSRLGLLQSSGGDELVAELIELFVGDVPARLELIREALSAADGEALMRSAHSLKGSAATIGAVGMAELCRQIEVHGRAGEVAPAEAVFETLGTEFERVRLALNDWVAAL